jgi:hypothetical protein
MFLTYQYKAFRMVYHHQNILDLKSVENGSNVRFQVLTVANMKITVFWVVAP